MKRKSILFIAACLVLCLIPSVGMLFFPTTQTTENKTMAAPPALIAQDGSLNKAFIQDFEAYFNEHIALRNPLVFADACIQTGLFQESNVSGVIAGTDGWLYYASTLSDYLGTGILSSRQLYNLANNFAIVQDYLQAKNIDFVLTIAPNKNTLYGEHMPYYKARIVDPDHSAVLLKPYLEDRGVRYLDLFTLFESQDEVLYLKTDSHWNNKGAFLVYNQLMDTLSLPHADASQAIPTLVKNKNGDLNRMLYSFYGKAENDYDYGLPQNYTYEKEDATVEDGWIVTRNPAGSGTLLMFRDSFANTLIPFFSNAFETACYSKGEPNAMERYVQTYSPDCVILEKVERNISNYLENPPILTPVPVSVPESFTIASTDTALQIDTALYDPAYYVLSGTLDPERLQDDSQIFVSVNDVLYPAYQTGDATFTLYQSKAALPEESLRVQVYLRNAGHWLQVYSDTCPLPPA